MARSFYKGETFDYMENGKPTGDHLMIMDGIMDGMLVRRAS